MKIVLQLIIFCCLHLTTVGNTDTKSVAISIKNTTFCDATKYVSSGEPASQISVALSYKEHFCDLRTLQLQLHNGVNSANHQCFTNFSKVVINNVIFIAFLKRVKRYCSTVCYKSGASSRLRNRSE